MQLQTNSTATHTHTNQHTHTQRHTQTKQKQKKKQKKQTKKIKQKTDVFDWTYLSIYDTLELNVPRSSNPPAKIGIEMIYDSTVENTYDMRISVNYIYPGMRLGILYTYVDLQGRRVIMEEWPNNMTILQYLGVTPILTTKPYVNLIFPSGETEYPCDKNNTGHMGLNGHDYACKIIFAQTSSIMNLNQIVQLLTFFCLCCF